MILLLIGCIANRCDSVQDLPPADVVAIGDSILAWNAKRCRSAIDAASRVLGEQIDNQAENGAQLLVGIPSQLRDSDATTVIVDGGGNDLNATGVCKGDDPSAVLDSLASADGTTGELPELVDRLVDDGRRVLVLGYYGAKPGGWYGLGACGDEVEVLKARYEALAARHQQVAYLDLELTIPTDRNDLYAFDAVHPSPKGADALGEAIAAALLDLQTR